MERKGSEHPAPLMKSHPAKGRVTRRPGIVEDRGKVQAFGAGVSDDVPGGCIKKRLSFSVTGDPVPGDIVS
jgi:hypothetical protein